MKTEPVAIPNVFEERLIRRKPALVICRLTRTAEVTFLAAAAGYHAVYIDMQHSTISLDETAQICAAAIGAGTTALVRVPALDPGLNGRRMDGGAIEIIAPDIPKTPRTPKPS